MTENVTGYGWKLEIGAATGSSLPAEGSETWSLVKDIEGLTPPSATRQTQEWFVLDLKASKKIPGSISYTACTGTLTRAYDEEPHDRMEDDSNGIVGGVSLGSTPRRQFRITAINSGQERRIFAGYVTKFEIQEVTNTDRVKVSIEITVDGDVTVIR
jgi:hypothetical protein